MVKENEKKKWFVKLFYNTLALTIAFFSSAFLWYWNIGDEWSAGYNGFITLTAVGVLFCIVYWFFAKMYSAKKIGLYRMMELLYFQGLSFIIADFILFVETVIWFHGFEKLNIFSYGAVYLVQMFLIAVSIFICNRLFARLDSPRDVMIIYGSEDYYDFLNELYKKKNRYNVVGCYHEDILFKDIKDIIDTCQCIYLYDVHTNLRREIVIYCQSLDKQVYITQNIDELLMRGYDVSHTFDIPLMRTKKVKVKWYYPVVKRVFDIVASSLAIIVLSPVFLVTAIAIKLYDGGPVLYKQIRLTKGHREFEIYKFRSMIVNAEKEGARLSSQNDDRITPVGKIIRMTRIDELPQLFNILKGDMSIIGPRPERPEIEKEYLQDLPEFALRLEVPAGLSGYAQVFGKYNTTPENKLKLDLLYIINRSLLLDIKIIFYTIKILFLPESTEGVETVKVYSSPIDNQNVTEEQK